MRVEVRFYSTIQLKLKKKRDEFIVDDQATVGDLLDSLVKRYSDKLQGILFNSSDKSLHVKLIRNGHSVSSNERLREDDVISIIPPVAGG